MADPGSTLHLEPPSAAAGPFHPGDHLRLESGALEKEIRFVTVLKSASWPWVLVQVESAPVPYELWIDFTHIATATRVDDLIVSAVRLFAESDD